MNRKLSLQHLELEDQLKAACKDAVQSVIAAQTTEEAFAFLDGEDHADVISVKLKTGHLLFCFLL